MQKNANTAWTTTSVYSAVALAMRRKLPQVHSRAAKARAASITPEANWKP